MASSAQMATIEDDRKQRFRFHKDDEILLLQIVLRAKPCPYKISSRDGAIMVAWNSIAEEFKALCKPRHDGIVPHSRTCRTRTDKLIADFLANRATAHLRPQKQETKEDKIKNSLVTKLAAIQGKIEAPPPDPSDPSNNTAESPIMPGSVSGTAQSNTPAHLLAQGSSSVPSSLSDLQIHGHSHSQQQQQQHRVSGGLSATSLMPQSLVNIGSSNGHRMNHGQSTSDLLTASNLLLATTNASGGGLHNSHHQNSSPPNLFANPGSDQRSREEGSQPQTSTTGRKRRGNRNSTSAVPPVSTSQTPATDYLQRPASAHPEHHAITPAPKRLRSGAVTAQNHSGTSANTFDQQNGSKSNSNSNNNSNINNTKNNSNNGSNNNNSNSSGYNSNIHIPNHTRPFLGGMGTSLGSNLPAQDMSGLSSVSNVGGNDDGHDEDDDDNEDDEGDDNESDAGGNGNGGYPHDQDNDFDNDYDGGYGQQDDVEYAHQTDASALLSLQNGSFSSNDNGKNNNNNNRSNKSSKRVAKRTADRGKAAMPKYNREAPSPNWPVPMHPASSNNGSGNEAVSSTAGPSYFVPSQLNAEDRAYLMRTLALEEQRVKVEVEKIAVERERLALERSRLQWEMRQMN
ncbi:hypothetical protein BGZ70_007535 [Mortierella alpina]|uniref:Uncharacterized protein n=1 Tax=Mortierella alpina TaxID=64518 RepID=A0A9P6M2V7_MORAP|nr:hypothetical protein BGZ70_007535 [Mortierella alpina]